MKSHLTSIGFSLAILTSSVTAEPEYPSLPSKVLANFTLPKTVDRSVQAQLSTTQSFLESLTEEQRKLAQLDFKHEAKHGWTNLPQPAPQTGIRIGDLNQDQITKALTMLTTVLSEAGFQKAIAIPLADDLLLNNKNPHPGYGAEHFWILISGQPSSTEPWAVQFDGHHLAYNITIKGDAMSMSPSFIGTRPKSVNIQGKQVDLLEQQYQEAQAFLNSLSQQQVKKLIVAKKRGRIATGAGKDGVIPKLNGLLVNNLSIESKELLLKLIGSYVNDLPKKAATLRLNALKKEFDQTYIAWSGPIKKNSNFSYKIQGPSLIIEFSHQGRNGDHLDHLHAIYRDPTNEYGKKLIVSEK